MIRPLRLATLLLAAAPIACAAEVADERAQWVVSIGTDAPVPQLGDRLLVEVLDASGEVACAGCRRQFGADPSSESAGLPISFGLVPRGDAPPRVRARLYRAARTGMDGLPEGTDLLDATGVLPEAAGVTEASLALRMACFGVAGDPALGVTCDPQTGALGPQPALAGGALPATGSWSGAAAVPCAGEVPASRVCVEGAAFLLGGDGFTDFAPSRPERLVRIAPFALDLDEVTVGEVKTLLAEGAIGAAPAARGLPGSVLEGCTYLPDGPDNDALPVNCISQDLAREICEARGGRLPTEAEWELAAGNRTRETTYPWGEDDDHCAHAIVGRGRAPQEVGLSIEATTCRSEGEPWGPVASGSAGDATDLGVRNMGGNVAEWVEGFLGDYDDPCFGEGILLEDPVCELPPLSALPAVRGGSWVDPPFTSRSVVRRGWDKTQPELAMVATGVRCAQSMR